MTTRLLAAVAALALVLGVPAPASADREPIKNTTYSGQAQIGDTLVTASVKIGKTKKKVKKLIFDVSCPEGARHEVFRNLKIVDSSFGRDVGGEGFAAEYNIRGVWFTKHKLNLILYVNDDPCATMADYYLKD
jgi:hypothetical protein